MSLKENLTLAKSAIKYMDKFHIVSINVPFRLGSYHKLPFSRYDLFLFYLMRAEGNLGTEHAHYRREKASFRKDGVTIDDTNKAALHQHVAGIIGNSKALRTQALAILRSNDSKSEKKRKITKLMDSVNFDPDTFDFYGKLNRTDAPDESRIRCTRRAIKYKHGNCMEKAAVVASWLLEQTQNTKDIYWMGANNWDHAWCVMTDKGESSLAMIKSVPIKYWFDSAVVVDGWTSDWYPAKHSVGLLHGGTAANPFQHYVRHKVQESSGDNQVMEKCEWPPKFCPTFTMANAHKPNKTYDRSPVLDIADDSEGLEEVNDVFESSED